MRVSMYLSIYLSIYLIYVSIYLIIPLFIHSYIHSIVDVYVLILNLRFFFFVIISVIEDGRLSLGNISCSGMIRSSKVRNILRGTFFLASHFIRIRCTTKSSALLDCTYHYDDVCTNLNN